MRRDFSPGSLRHWPALRAAAPNRWDIVLLPVVIGVMFLIAWGGKQMAVSYTPGAPLSLSLEPAHLRQKRCAMTCLTCGWSAKSLAEATQLEADDLFLPSWKAWSFWTSRAGGFSDGRRSRARARRGHGLGPLRAEIFTYDYGKGVFNRESAEEGPSAEQPA